MITPTIYILYHSVLGFLRLFTTPAIGAGREHRENTGVQTVNGHFRVKKPPQNYYQKGTEHMERTQFEYEIKQHIATLTEDESAEYQKQLNIVGWKGAKPSLDLRLWRITAEGQRPLKGLTLSAEEAEKLYNALKLWKHENARF